MCLAEALLRVPDSGTIDALIEDKIAPSDWSKHIGQSTSPLVNASTWGLLLTGKVLGKGTPGVSGTLRHLIKRLGEPVVRTAVGQAMREMGRQFVLGENIHSAMKRAATKEEQGFSYSYDMLGEAAMTMADARRYQQAYSEAIAAIAEACDSENIVENPGISVKLSALHPRYEVAKKERVMNELLPSLLVLAHQAAAANMGLNIDAEEADRLGLSLELIEAVMSESILAGWSGFGIVVQAYGRRSSDVIDGLYEMAERYDRKIMVRLVKGAYWDTEIKQAQVDGLDDFPVFTHKAATSYIANARKLLSMTHRIYPQFATHNAHSVAAILHMSKGLDPSAFELQRLHGMGEALHDIVHDAVREAGHTRCRVYAPVGAHRDLLAYLVRRLLENGANSSFVNQIVDHNVAAKPAETTSAVAAWAVKLMYEAGVPRNVLQLLPGEGSVIGKALTADSRVNGVAFTGSTLTARSIQQSLAQHAKPGAPFIAETGGLNAMIVDSTALPEQVIRDVMVSAFQSVGQRCSALRCLYVQEDIEPVIRTMLIGAMEELQLGDPWLISTDIGPVITSSAKTEFSHYVAQAASEGRLLHQLKSSSKSQCMPPSLLKVSGIEMMEREIFGPVLHLATFKAGEVDKVIESVNATGYGLTFGLHSRIDDRVQQITDSVQAGNIYANRNQIGAIVGSQPFGGHGLSGTGPKAGGPHYVGRFTCIAASRYLFCYLGRADVDELMKEIQAKTHKGGEVTESIVLPGPTGELNRFGTLPRPPVLCLGPGEEVADAQKKAVESLGGIGIAVPERLLPETLKNLPKFSALMWWGEEGIAREYALALSNIEGSIIPIVTDMPDKAHVLYERHLCVDTTAAGGNTSLLAGE